MLFAIYMVDVCNKMCEVWVLPRATAAFSSSCVGGNQPTSDTKPHTAVCNRIHNHKHRMYTLQCAPDCKHLEAQCPPNTPTSPPLIHSPPPRPQTLHKAHTRRCILLCVKCKRRAKHVSQTTSDASKTTHTIHSPDCMDA